MRVGVVGHVEWIDFVPVERVPGPGDIVVAPTSWGHAAGGGGVAAACLARLAGEATLLTALGDDDFGRAALEQLGGLGVTADVAWRADGAAARVLLPRRGRGADDHDPLRQAAAAP